MAEIKITIPKLTCGLLGLSVTLHAGLLLMASGWIVCQRINTPPTPEAYAETSPPLSAQWDAPEPEPESLDPEPADDTDAALSPAALTVTPDSPLNNSVTLPAFATALAPVAGLLPASPTGGSGGGITNSGGSSRDVARGKITVGKLFNTRVESAKLGVLLDVSSSAHPCLPPTVSEIERNFSDAVIILTYGCGLYEKAAADSMYIKELSRCKPDTAGAKNTLGQIAKAADSDTGALFKKMRARPGTYVLYAENCGHTYYGFKKLLDEKVDTIYWFADFRDKISARVANKLIQELQQRHVKVIAHNFTGKPVPEEGETIARATGGSTIEKKILR